MTDFDTALRNEYDRLVGLCGYLTGGAEDAPDLAQETLIEAWRHQHKLVNPSGLRPWVSAIARNVCLRWKAKAGRTQSLLYKIAQQPEETSGEASFELLLERHELSGLLQEALALLPGETRAALVARFIEELSPAEIAERLGITENNVTLRLHRGKGALENIVRGELHEEFAKFDLFDTTGSWQTTSFYCPMCGEHKLQGKLNTVAGKLLLRCPSCNSEPGDLLNATEALPQVLGGVKGFKPAYNRLLSWGAGYYVPGLRAGEAPCTACGRMVHPTLKVFNGQYKIDASCQVCGCINYSALEGMAFALPEGLRFWRENPRVRMLADQPVAEAEGEPAVLFSRESVTTGRRFEVLFGLKSYKFLRVGEA